MDNKWSGKIGKAGKMLVAAAGITLGVGGQNELKGQKVFREDSIELQQEKKDLLQSIDDRISFAINTHDYISGIPWGAILSKPYTYEILSTLLERSKRIHGDEESGPKKNTYLQLLVDNIYMFKKEPYAEELIKKIGEESVARVLHNVDEFIDEPYALRVVEEIFENYWGYNFSYRLLGMNQNKKLKELLKKSENPTIKKIVEIADYREQAEQTPYLWIKDSDKMLALVEEMVNDNLSIPEANQLSNIPADSSAKKTEYLKHLLRIKNKPDHLMSKHVEFMLGESALWGVQDLNRLHERPEQERFKSVQDYDSKMLYTLMAYSEEEIFTSSFNGLFNRLLEKAKAEGKSGDVLLEEVQYGRFRTFIKECASFNRLDEFLSTMTPEKQEILLKKFVQGIEKEEGMLSQAVTVADAFGTLKDSTTLEIFQKTIKEEYVRSETENSKQGKILYGLLAGLFAEKGNKDEAWVKEMSAKYKLEDLSEIKSKELFNVDSTNIQQYFFYNDEDGENSFKNFMFQYEHKRDWKVEKTETYVHITSIGTGKRIEIYANLPKSESDGPDEIGEKLKERDVKSIVIVHRGHSYHAQETINRITPTAKIVWLGSCGGYNNMSEVLAKSPSAHIISTKGTGTMKVNDPLLKMLNNDILVGKDIEWDNFWQKAKLKLGDNDDFQKYVAPNRNMGVMFLKAYNKITSSE